MLKIICYLYFVIQGLYQNLAPILGIESELREILINLICNASDAMPSGGEIMIQTEKGNNVEISDSCVMLKVSDSGIGMDEETRKKCMDPFYTTKEKCGGSGLGLSIVRSIMDKHKGIIKIESEIGKGTAIQLFFPSSETAKETTKDDKITLPQSPLRILCIDDEHSILTCLKRILEKYGHSVELADGLQVKKEDFLIFIKKEKPFDAIITDLGMPLISGYEVANIIKRESPNTPVIMFTGWRDQLKSELAKEIGIDYMLSKPPKFNELQKILAEIEKNKNAQ